MSEKTLCGAGVLDWLLTPLVPSCLCVCVAGLVYRALGFPPQFFTVLFAVPRVTGYLSHWRESLTDPDTKILRPQQDYRVSPVFQVLFLNMGFLVSQGPSPGCCVGQPAFVAVSDVGYF